jgi:hypothetical protein
MPSKRLPKGGAPSQAVRVDAQTLSMDENATVCAPAAPGILDENATAAATCGPLPSTTDALAARLGELQRLVVAFELQEGAAAGAAAATRGAEVSALRAQLAGAFFVFRARDPLRPSSRPPMPPPLPLYKHTHAHTPFRSARIPHWHPSRGSGAPQ